MDMYGSGCQFIDLDMDIWIWMSRCRWLGLSKSWIREDLRSWVGGPELSKMSKMSKNWQNVQNPGFFRIFLDFPEISGFFKFYPPPLIFFFTALILTFLHFLLNLLAVSRFLVLVSVALLNFVPGIRDTCDVQRSQTATLIIDTS